MHVTGDREVCVGAGLCVLTAPDVFDQDADGLVVVLQEDPPEALREAVGEAVGICPSGALRLR